MAVAREVPVVAPGDTTTSTDVVGVLVDTSDLHRPTAMRGAHSPGPATAATDATIERRHGARRRGAAPRPVPPAPAGQEVPPPGRGFSVAGLCGYPRERRSISLRSTDGFTRRTSTRHQGSTVVSTPVPDHVPELRLLENGREDRTPVRAVRRGSRPRSALRSNCLSIHVVGFPPGDERLGSLPRHTIQVRSHGSPGFHRFVRSSNQSFGQPGTTARVIRQAFVGEFDPGSGRTLAACLTHASRTRSSGACSAKT